MLHYFTEKRAGMTDFSSIKTLEELRDARRENEKARKELCGRLVHTATDVVDCISPKRWLAELMDWLSPLMKICRMFTESGR